MTSNQTKTRVNKPLIVIKVNKPIKRPESVPIMIITDFISCSGGFLT